MDWEILFDRSRMLFNIGYFASDHRLDPTCYDLLASEARFCSFISIAQKNIPQEHWFALGRQLTSWHGEPVLLSWSGSIFEYLMPLLVMPTYQDTLLDHTAGVAVRRQIAYGKEQGIPWGISESCYNMTDYHMIYQYQAFGVPGLGYKRGLEENIVIAPYASALALMVSREEACLNLQRLSADGYEGRYGFYEAIDFTPSRLSAGQSSAVIRSFMAHHQGMSLLALAYALLEQPMQRRFMSDPLFRATEPLLQERIPKAAPIYLHRGKVSPLAAVETEQFSPRAYSDPNLSTPEVHLMSNNTYSVMVTHSGGGYSKWKDLAITRWSEDATRDNKGMFCYLRDMASNEFWSTGYQPTLKTSDDYQAIFSQVSAEFRRKDHGIESHTVITVSPEDDIELRRITVTNNTRHRRMIELTSYAEIVLAAPASDMNHPVFSNLFVETKIVSSHQAILCHRRPRSPEENPPWLLHLMATHGNAFDNASYETDRREFIGRGRTLQDPAAMHLPGALSNSEGAVLDPITAIRHVILLEPDESATIDYVTGIADVQERALGLIEKYRDRRLADRVLDLAWTHRQVALRQLNVSESEAQLFDRLAGSVVYANDLHRADPNIIMKNNRGQSGLWGYGISGDLPVVLVRINHEKGIDLARQMVRAHSFWRLSGLAVDLLIWNEVQSGYRQPLQDLINGIVGTGTTQSDRGGGIFMRQSESISAEDRILMMSAARIIITDTAGSLTTQLQDPAREEHHTPRLRPRRMVHVPPGSPRDKRQLEFFNGYGGFTPDGKEYVMELAAGITTPAPWVNVIANPQFGTVISESGAAYTWSENAHEFRLTPWYNDPVCDKSGEALYIRDEDTGKFWSPTPLPAGEGWTMSSDMVLGTAFLSTVTRESPQKSGNISHPIPR